MQIGIFVGVLLAVTYITIQKGRIKKEGERKEKIDSFKKEFKLDESKKIDKVVIPEELKPVVSVKPSKKSKKK